MSATELRRKAREICSLSVPVLVCKVAPLPRNVAVHFLWLEAYRVALRCERSWVLVLECALLLLSTNSKANKAKENRSLFTVHTLLNWNQHSLWCLPRSQRKKAGLGNFELLLAWLVRQRLNGTGFNLCRAFPMVNGLDLWAILVVQRWQLIK